MFPAICRGRALHLCFLAAVTVTSACASYGPGTPPVSAPGPLAPSMSDSPIPGSSSPRPAPASPPPGAGSPGPRVGNSSKPRLESLKPRTDSRKPRAESAKPKTEAARPKTESSRSRVAETPRQRIRQIVPRTSADSIALELAITKRLAHQPLAIALGRRMRNPELADRVASAVVYEASRNRLSPSLLAGVLLIENTPVDTSAISTEGAIGLMQVMPVHVGSYGCLSGDLLSVEDNICHGARLLHTYIRRAKSTEEGLRRYNGCVRGRNTPRCHRYPGRVLRTASYLRRDVILAAAKLERASAESQAISSSKVGADLPADVEESDSAATPGSDSAQCGTFFACLRHSWKLDN
jgi:transglycosylase-like protein with SLT domain